MELDYGTYKPWITIFFISILLGVVFALLLAGIIYGARVKDPNNKLTYTAAIGSTIMPGIYLGLAGSLLFILSNKYKYKLELIILCAILLSGILASIGTSMPWQSLIAIGTILLYVFAKWGILNWIKPNEKKAEFGNSELMPLIKKNI